ASAQHFAISWAWISEPPASGSSRSRHARMLTRRRPASAATSPSLAMVASWSIVRVGARGRVRHRSATRHDRRSGERTRPARAWRDHPRRGEYPTDVLPPTRTGFEETLAAVADVEGWMTDAQAQRLWDRALHVTPGG